MVVFLKDHGRILGSSGSPSELEKAIKVADSLKENVLHFNAFIEGFSDTAAAVDLWMVNLGRGALIDDIYFSLLLTKRRALIDYQDFYRAFVDASSVVNSKLVEMRKDLSAAKLDLYNAQRINIQTYIRKTLSLQDMHERELSFKAEK